MPTSLLQALLTNEFRGLTMSLDHMEKDTTGLKADLSLLKESDLERRLHRNIRALASQALDVRRARVVHGPLRETAEDFADRVEDALEGGRITDGQDAVIEATDIIVHAQRRSDRATVWIAVEASSRVHAGDIKRARATADALRTVFNTDAMAVVVGYGIDPLDAQRAKASHVRYLEVSPPRPV